MTFPKYVRKFSDGSLHGKWVNKQEKLAGDMKSLSIALD